MELLEDVISQSPFFQCVHPEILHQDITLLNELAQNLKAPVGFEIEREAAFIAVDA
jgi:hypothetical protein